jgi:hypothetical protein
MKPLLVTLALLLLPGLLAQVPPRVPAELLEQAVATPAPRWKFVDHRRYREMPQTFALQMTAVAAHEAPQYVVQGKPLATHLAEKVRFFLVTPQADPDGTTREPESSGGLGGWTHNAAAQVLLLAQRTPATWQQLSADERARADLLMQAMAVAAHFTLDDDNDYYLMLDGVSLFHRSWNPNHVGYGGVIVAASLYFGPESLNAFFQSFDFDAFLARVEAANFQNIRRCWTYRPFMRDLLMRGGPIALPDDAVIAAGVVTTGAGVRNAFTWDGIALDQPWALHRAQAVRLYSKAARTVVVVHPTEASSLLGRHTGAAVSPWEGQMGMGHEFESIDWAGLRTSATYAFEGVMIDLCTASTLKVLGEWRAAEGGDMLERRMGVGMADLRFKAKEGYRGWSNGKEHTTTWEQDLVPMGADFIFGLWESYFAPPPPPLQAPRRERS